MKAQREHVIDTIFSLSLLCVFTVCGLLVVFIGVNVYENTVISMEESFADRTAMSYVVKQIRQNDRADGVSIETIEGVTALVLSEEVEGETFATYIYYYDGYLQEIYAKDTYEPVLAAGQQLIEVDGFSAEINDNGTITVSIYETEEEMNQLTLALQSQS